MLYPTIWLYILGAVNASREDTHIRANVLEIAIKTERGHTVLAIVGEIISLTVGLWLLSWAWEYTQYAWRVWKESPTLYLPTFYSEVALVAGLGLMMLYTAMRAEQRVDQHHQNQKRERQRPKRDIGGNLLHHLAARAHQGKNLPVQGVKGQRHQHRQQQAQPGGMIESVLTYTRAEMSAETPRRLSLTSLVEAVAADYQDFGKPVELLRPAPQVAAGGRSVFTSAPGRSAMPPDQPMLVVARPVSLQRAVTNLIDNALKYGRRAAIGLSATADHAVITVEDEGSGMLPQHGLNGLPVPRGRRHDAAGAQHRLADEGRDGIRALAFDQRLQLRRAMGHELFLALVQIRAAEIVRRLGVNDLFHRQVELLVKQLQPGQRAGDQPRPVIAAPARDDLLLLRPAQDVVVIPDQLDVGLIRVRAAKAEIDLGHIRRCPVQDHLGQRDRGLGAMSSSRSSG